MSSTQWDVDILAGRLLLLRSIRESPWVSSVSRCDDSLGLLASGLLRHVVPADSVVSVLIHQDLDLVVTVFALQLGNLSVQLFLCAREGVKRGLHCNRLLLI